MLKIKIFIASLVLIMFIQSCHNNKPEISIIPIPVKSERLEGNFVLPNPLTICVQPADSNLMRIAGFIAKKLWKTYGYKVTLINSNSIKDKSIYLSIDTTFSDKEGYKLNISSNSITISGFTAEGVFYGIHHSSKYCLQK